MRGALILFAATFAATVANANASSAVKSYTVEAAFAADDQVVWTVAATPEASRALHGATAGGAVVAIAGVETGSLERLAPPERREGGRAALATSFRSRGNGAVTVAFGPTPVMGVGVRFEGATGRITARNADGNVLGVAVSDGNGFAGIRSASREIASVAIDGPSFTAYQVSIALVPVTENDVFFVNQLFRDITGRTPSASEVEDKVAAIRGGVITRAELAASMLTAGDFHEQAGYLARCFLALMRRDADFLRFSQIYSLMQGGASKETVMAGFLRTPEVAAAYPADLTDAAFIAKVHQDLLGRLPVGSETELWSNQLSNGGSRLELIETLLDSPELEERLAARINVSLAYLTLLRHESGAETADRLTAALGSGKTLTDIINSILSSPEYTSRF